MQSHQGLSFLPTGTILVLGLVLVTVTGVMCWLAWHRTGYRKWTGILELLRFALVCLVMATLCQPEWLKTRPPDQSPTLVVLWDKSNSMATRDIIDNEDISGQPKSRAETIKPLISETIWKPIDNELELLCQILL